MIDFYKKKPVTIKAVQWTGDNFGEIEQIARDCNPNCSIEFEDGHLRILTLEGTFGIGVGNWVIRGIKDEIYPCADDVFKATYSLIEE